MPNGATPRSSGNSVRTPAKNSARRLLRSVGTNPGRCAPRLLSDVNGLSLLPEGSEPLKPIPGRNDRFVSPPLQQQPGAQPGLAPLVDCPFGLLHGDGA